MRIVFSILLTLHGLIHLMGLVKAFELAPLDALKQPISRPMGLVWGLAALLLLGAVAALFMAPRAFWVIGGAALLVSQLAIASSWQDARFGTVANGVLLAAVVYAAFAWGPFGLRAAYFQRVLEGSSALVQAGSTPVITEADLVPLPAPVQRYLRAAGVVGSPRVQGFRARMRGRIRSSAGAPWMPFVAEQTNFYDPPRRTFFLEATRGGLPLDGLHRYDATAADMRIRLLSLLEIIHVEGPALLRTETVTVLNDVCLFAPGRLLDPAFQWREIDARHVEVRYTVGTNTVKAVLVFDDAGMLVNFWSDDRPALAEDGVTLLSQRWSTPVRDPKHMGGLLLPSRGEARYGAPTGEYAYIELEIEDVVPLPVGAQAGGQRSF